ncbi:MAG: hypothetical protein U0172_10595 [Nitrospiraceae bacterium]
MGPIVSDEGRAADPLSAASLRRVMNFQRRGRALQLWGCGLLYVAALLSTIGPLVWPKTIMLFGTTIVGPKVLWLWPIAVGLLAALGDAWAFERTWRWEMTMAMLGFQCVSDVLSAAADGVTGLRVGSLLAVVATASYLLWRRDVVQRPAPVPLSARRNVRTSGS